MRHFDYIDHYERIVARERAKKKPRLDVIASAMEYVTHSRARIEILNEEYAAQFFAN